MSSFRCILTLAGQDFPVVLCNYEFEQATTERGRATAKVRSGLISLSLDVPDGDQLFAWANDPHKKLSGYLTFYQTNSPIAREILAFEDAFCVSYNEVFQSGAEPQGAYRCLLQVSAARLALNAATKDSAWAQTR
jgi:hypothetical protein